MLPSVFPRVEEVVDQSTGFCCMPVLPLCKTDYPQHYHAGKFRNGCMQAFRMKDMLPRHIPLYQFTLHERPETVRTIVSFHKLLWFYTTTGSYKFLHFSFSFSILCPFKLLLSNISIKIELGSSFR